MSKHDALSVANRLIGKGIDGGNFLTPLQVIKLTYFCQGWMLGLYGRPLFRQAVEAWRYGPVVADVYYALKHYGKNAVRNPIPGVATADLDELESDLVDQVYDCYGEMSGWQLSRLTHMSGTPWDTFSPKGGQTVIPDAVIKQYYASMTNDDAAP